MDLASLVLRRQPADPLAAYVLLVLRLPRILAAVLVGAALALAGSVTRSLLQNPLAEPGVLGISAGASFTALFALIVLHVPQAFLPVIAAVGATGTGLCVVWLARGFGRGNAPANGSVRLVLSGIMLSIVFSAGILAIVSYGEISQSNEILRWMVGSLSDVGWQRVAPILIVFPLLLPVVLFSARTLRHHTMGEERARSLGARNQRGP